MENSKIIVVNWKMYFTYRQACDFVQVYGSELEMIAQKSSKRVIVCPSYEVLARVRQLMPESILLGAQDCSSYPTGAYTGQVSAASLSELGCQAVIVGHHETRMHQLLGCKQGHVSYAPSRAMGIDFELQEDRRKKVKLVLDAGMVPIICVGESKEEKNAGGVLQVIARELAFLARIRCGACAVKSSDDGPAKCFCEVMIAYEPYWAIGTGLLPDAQYLSQVVTCIRDIARQAGFDNIKILYGGSLSSQTLSTFQEPYLNGFLVGRASTDFQELKKIVS